MIGLGIRKSQLSLHSIVAKQNFVSLIMEVWLWYSCSSSNNGMRLIKIIFIYLYWYTRSIVVGYVLLFFVDNFLSVYYFIFVFLSQFSFRLLFWNFACICLQYFIRKKFKCTAASKERERHWSFSSSFFRCCSTSLRPSWKFLFSRQLSFSKFIIIYIL